MSEEIEITEGCKTAANIIVGGIVSFIQDTDRTRKGIQPDEAQKLLRQTERIISKYTSPEYENEMQRLKETLKRVRERRPSRD